LAGFVGLKFFRYDWRTKKREVVKQRMEVNGCAFNQAAAL
jgi:hypothetical protein